MLSIRQLSTRRCLSARDGWNLAIKDRRFWAEEVFSMGFEPRDFIWIENRQAEIDAKLLEAIEKNSPTTGI
jgi:hypothetical protein